MWGAEPVISFPQNLEDQFWSNRPVTNGCQAVANQGLSMPGVWSLGPGGLKSACGEFLTGGDTGGVGRDNPDEGFFLQEAGW